MPVEAIETNFTRRGTYILGISESMTRAQGACLFHLWPMADTSASLLTDSVCLE